jgi:hypothetical protein
VDGAKVTFDQIHNQWEPFPSGKGYDTSGEMFENYLRRVCVHCWQEKKLHAKRKCLFGPWMYQALPGKVANYYHAWYHSLPEATDDHNMFWGTDVDDIP